ncbi:MAG: response regulator [Alphaproteobacteria bacterium]|nr:response regulator [Alphaproteobacteria bacterium]
MAPDKAPSRTLIVVDDDHKIRATIRDIAESDGWTVLEAENGKHMVEVCTKAKAEPDLVLLDMVMPEADGFEALERIEKLKCRARIVIMSGFAPHLAEAGVTIGRDRGLDVVGPLLKPFSNQDLRGVLTGTRRQARA